MAAQKPMTYNQKVGRFCMKSGPLTGRKRATNSMKVNEYNLLNVQLYKAHEIFRLKGKIYKMVTIFGVFLIYLPARGVMTARKKLKIWISESRRH